MSEKPVSGIVSSPHRHDELELLLIYSGVFCVNVQGKDYVGKAGDVIFVNSGGPHATHAIEPSTTGLLQFKQTNFLDADVARIIKYSVRLSDLSGEPVKILRAPELFASIKEIFDESVAKRTAYDFFIKSGIYRDWDHGSRFPSVPIGFAELSYTNNADKFLISVNDTDLRGASCQCGNIVILHLTDSRIIY